MVNTPLRQLTQLFQTNVTIVGVAREQETFIPTADDQLLEGDEAYVVVDSSHVQHTFHLRSRGTRSATHCDFWRGEYRFIFGATNRGRTAGEYQSDRS